MNNKEMQAELKKAGREIPHPGEVLEELFHEGFKFEDVAKDTGLGKEKLRSIYDGTVKIDTEIAYILGYYNGSTSGNFLNLQSNFEIQFIRFCKPDILKGIKKRNVKFG